MVFIDEQWRQRLKKAGDTILRFKWEDGLRNGQTIKEIAKKTAELTIDYNRNRERLIFETQALNALPNELPEDFSSVDQIMEAFGAPAVQEKLDVGDGMIVDVLPHSDRFLTPDLLTSLTQRWLNVNRLAKGAGVAHYYYNKTFVWTVLRYQSRTVESGELDRINFHLNVSDRPLVYAHYPEEPVRDPNQLRELIKQWNLLHSIYEAEQERLSDLEMNSNRGDFILSLEEPYGRIFHTGDEQEVFEIESRMFSDLLEYLYRLSEEHPKCFGQGAQAILDGLYQHYKPALFGDWPMDQAEFETKFIRQFLYMTNDEVELRVDLFRHLQIAKKGNGQDFIGGLFHVFNHFKGLQFRQTKESLELHEGFLFQIIRDLFFSYRRFDEKLNDKGEQHIAEHQFDTPTDYTKDQWRCIPMNWRAVFYYSYDKNCYSLTTLHPI